MSLQELKRRIENCIPEQNPPILDMSVSSNMDGVMAMNDSDSSNGPMNEEEASELRKVFLGTIISSVSMSTVRIQHVDLFSVSAILGDTILDKGP